MVDDVLLDLATAAAHAGLSIVALQSLAASGAIVVVGDLVSTRALSAWSETDRAARRTALAALAAGIGTEVFY